MMYLHRSTSFRGSAVARAGLATAKSLDVNFDSSSGRIKFTPTRQQRLCLQIVLLLMVCCCPAAAIVPSMIYTETGRLTVVDTSYHDGGHRSDYMFLAEVGGLYSLICTTDSTIFNSLVSGGLVRVTSNQAPEVGVPWDILTLEIVTPPPPPLAPFTPSTPPGEPPPPSSPFFPSIPLATVASSTTAMDITLSTGSTSGSSTAPRSSSWSSQWNPGVFLNEVVADPPRVVRDLPTLFILLDLCGKGGGPATTNESLENMLFNGLTPMSDYIATCSYGKATFDQYNSRVLTIQLPCSGTGHVTKMPWDSSSCTRDNLLNWMYEVEWYIDNVLKPRDWNHRRYRHHVIITPRNMMDWAGPDCNWSGMGSIGMAQGTWSYVWISGDNWNTKQVYLHEIGHNYNLMHAATMERGDPESCSHCDWSSAMGYCCDTRCLSAPHNYQMGWAKPIATVNAAKLSPGNTLAFELPSQILTDANYLRVTTDWLSDTAVPESVISSFGGRGFYSPATATFMFSYRMSFRNFDELAPGFVGGTNVHLFSVADQADLKDSVHLELLTSGSPSWTDPSGTLIVRQVASSSLAAIVTVCRPDGATEATYEKCTDFWDNDCDGLVDADDPDCAQFYKPPPPPVPGPSPPSPPPRTPNPAPPPPNPSPPVVLASPPRPIVLPPPPSPPPPAQSTPPPPSSLPPPPPRLLDPPAQEASPPPPNPPSVSLAGSDIGNTVVSRRRRPPFTPPTPPPAPPPAQPPMLPGPPPPPLRTPPKPRTLRPPPSKVNKKKRPPPPTPPPPSASKVKNG
ncbi:hypothetical protein Vafri_12260 [Volvox africanus]|uniref:Peptidase M11 gametolysin domain-containing protein n=1 Tax=Volvox africanus TaxID=51714 RepID=A0A8J4F2I5_9CHLO|nr:hypothetical protein Vafri_12260 [Volvox africanus]